MEIMRVVHFEDDIIELNCMYRILLQRWCTETNERTATAHCASVPVQKKASVYPTTNVNGNPTIRSSTVTVNFPSMQYASPLMKRPVEPVTASAAATTPPALLIANLPKALTVTQISETVSSHRRSETQSSTMAAPFLVGEKPSVSVFREITKN
ncbi:hypothetical protein ACFE04_026207 [Oxalis oulophora]